MNASKSERAELLAEIDVMKKAMEVVGDKKMMNNIVNMLGCVTIGSDCVCLVMEYIPHGRLLDLLRGARFHVRNYTVINNINYIYVHVNAWFLKTNLFRVAILPVFLVNVFSELASDPLSLMICGDPTKSLAKLLLRLNRQKSQRCPVLMTISSFCVSPAAVKRVQRSSGRN